MNRKIIVTKKAQKSIRKLPVKVRNALFLLIKDIEENGVVRGNWKNYSKLSNTQHHCHLKHGKPTYVACWEEISGKLLIEVYYVGTHEKAPY